MATTPRTSRARRHPSRTCRRGSAARRAGRCRDSPLRGRAPGYPGAGRRLGWARRCSPAGRGRATDRRRPRRGRGSIRSRRQTGWPPARSVSRRKRRTPTSVAVAGDDRAAQAERSVVCDPTPVAAAGRVSVGRVACHRHVGHGHRPVLNQNPAADEISADVSHGHIAEGGLRDPRAGSDPAPGPTRVVPHDQAVSKGQRPRVTSAPPEKALLPLVSVTPEIVASSSSSMEITRSRSLPSITAGARPVWTIVRAGPSRSRQGRLRHSGPRPGNGELVASGLEGNRVRAAARVAAAKARVQAAASTASRREH